MTVAESIALWRQLGRTPGEDDAAYRARLPQVAAQINPMLEQWARETMVPRGTAWTTGAANNWKLPPPGAADAADLEQLKSQLQALRQAYDDVVWRLGKTYWRTLREQGPEAAEAELKRYLLQQGVQAQTVAEAAKVARQDAKNTENTINASLAIASAVAAAIPVAGWVVSAALSIVQAARALARAITSTVTDKELAKREQAWEQYAQNRAAWHDFEMRNRIEGAQTYRGFISGETTDFPELRQAVDRRLYTLSLASNFDWAAAFPVLPFGTVVAEPYLLDGMPDFAEGDALEIARRRQAAPSGGSPRSAAQRWYDRGRADQVAGKPHASEIPDFDPDLGVGEPWYFYHQGYIEAANHQPARVLLPQEVSEEQAIRPPGAPAGDAGRAAAAPVQPGADAPRRTAPASVRRGFLR